MKRELFCSIFASSIPAQHVQAYRQAQTRFCLKKRYKKKTRQKWRRKRNYDWRELIGVSVNFFFCITKKIMWAERLEERRFLRCVDAQERYGRPSFHVSRINRFNYSKLLVPAHDRWCAQYGKNCLPNLPGVIERLGTFAAGRTMLKPKYVTLTVTSL